MLKCLFSLKKLTLLFSKFDDLGNKASETNVLQHHRPQLFTSYAFGRFCSGPGGDFAVDTVKEEFGCLESFFSSTIHLARPDRAF
jgi:hypothetical protein